METKQESKASKVKNQTASTTPIRVKRETRKKILQELAKANKKDFGRKVRADDLIALALSFVRAEHIELLQDATLSNADRLDRRYKEFVAKHGHVSKDVFLGKLLAGSLGESEASRGALDAQSL